MRIAVAGGTGMVGRYVVELVRAAGHDPVVLARSRGVDLVSGTGLDEALFGVDAVVDVSNVGTTSRKKSVAFFEPATTNLLNAAMSAGVGHLVALSIVGVDRVDFGYYEGKRRQEELVRASPLSTSILRATQFHEFASQVLEQVPGPVAVVPRMRTQPVAAREVADALVALVLAPPTEAITELAGPQEEQLPDMARRLLRTRGTHRLVVPVRMPVPGGAAMASGGLLPTGPGPRSVQTYEEWLLAL